MLQCNRCKFSWYIAPCKPVLIDSAWLSLSQTAIDTARRIQDLLQGRDQANCWLVWARNIRPSYRLEPHQLMEILSFLVLILSASTAAAPLLRAPASRRCQSISISCPRGRALSSKPATRRCCGRSMWQTDRRTRRYTRLSDHSLTITSQTVFYSTWVLIARVSAAYQPQCDICSPKFWASCLEHVELGLLCYD